MSLEHSAPHNSPRWQPDPRAVCPVPVNRPWMIHRWDQLTFLHWRYEPEVVQQLLPPGLTVETFDGQAWVGLVPFVMQVRAPGLPAVPWLSNFPETNVRTYAVGPDGSTGVWFLSLDAARLPAVLGGRLGYRLPYFWSEMDVDHHDQTISYRSRRRWPRPTPSTSAIDVVIGDPYHPDELGELDHWLTARWALYSQFPRRTWFVRAQHPPWNLHRGEVSHLDENLMTSAGLPPPEGPPLVHYSPGTEIQVSGPRRVTVDGR